YWQWAGTCASRFPTATSRSCWPSGACTPTSHRLEVGPTLRPGNSAPISTAAPTDQRQLAGRRDLYPGEGQVGLSVPGCRLLRCNDRLLTLGQTRCSRRRKAYLDER